MDAQKDFLELIKNSWTFEKLTEFEKIKIINLLSNDNMTLNAIKGTYKQRWKILQAIYNAFLQALDYKPIGWRE